MLQSILSSRAILGGLVFFIMIVGGSWIYTWYVERDIKREASRTIQSNLQGAPHPEERSSTENTQKTETLDTPQTEGANTGSVEKQETEIKAAGLEPTGTPHSESLENALEEAKIAELIEQISTEEENAEVALSTEESRIQVLEQEQDALFAQIKELLATGGGPMNSSAHREKMRQVIQLQQEMLVIQEKIDGSPNLDANFNLTLALKVNNSLNQNGEMPVSEYKKIADYVESEGSLETASQMRVVIQRAINSGNDIIKPEHIKVPK